MGEFLVLTCATNGCPWCKPKVVYFFEKLSKMGGRIIHELTRKTDYAEKSKETVPVEGGGSPQGFPAGRVKVGGVNCRAVHRQPKIFE